METKHTPGPWKAYESADAGWFDIESEGGLDVLGYEGCAKEANARLIAAAPDLIEALDTLTLVVGMTPMKGNLEALQEAQDMARAAIKKATGQST